MIAGTCFVLENMILSYVIDTCSYTADYEEKMDRRYVQSMQKYINENEITIRDCSKLKKWAKKQHIMSVVIYQDRKKIFDSDYLNHDFLILPIRRLCPSLMQISGNSYST